MIKQKWMTIVAGEPLVDSMEAEQRAKVPKSIYGSFDSERLCELQREQSKRGLVGAEIVISIYGYSIRYDSGLQNFALIASGRCGDFENGYEGACDYVKAWVAKDPEKRYAWHRNGLV